MKTVKEMFDRSWISILYVVFFMIFMMTCFSCSDLYGNYKDNTGTYTAKYYTITFNANGGTGTMANQTVASGTSVILNANTFIRSGYSFTGWSTSSDATTVAYGDGAYYSIGASDVTLYAVWAILNTNGTLVINNQSSYNVFYLYIRPAGSSAWGTDRLGSSTIPSGMTGTITSISSGNCDIRAETSDHSTYWQKLSVTIPANGTFTWNLLN